MSVVSTGVANINAMTIIVAFILAGVRKRINVTRPLSVKEGSDGCSYHSLRGSDTRCHRSVFRASGAMAMLVDGIKGLDCGVFGGNTAFVGKASPQR